MIVREAELWDVPALFGLAEKFHGEATPGFPYPEPIAIQQTILETQYVPDTCCFVAEDKTICGFITGGCARFPHSEKRIAGLTMFYVAKEKRGSKAAFMLVHSFIEWCRSRNTTIVSVGSISGIKEERFGQLFERIGFRRAGTVYIRVL